MADELKREINPATWHEHVQPDGSRRYFKVGAPREALESRWARRLVESLRKDPDVLGEAAATWASSPEKGVLKYLQRQAKSQLSEAKGWARDNRNRAQLESLKKIDLNVVAKVFEAEVPRLAKAGVAIDAENERRSQHEAALQVGPRGGKYYVSVGGGHVYVTPNRPAAPMGKSAAPVGRRVG